MLRRRWVLAPVTASRRPSTAELRQTTAADDAALATLLDQAYVGTIDHDPEADHVGELETWRTVDGADDEASFVAHLDGELVGASLIGRELGAPFLYEIAVLEGGRGRGIARALLHASLDRLASRREPHIAAWVTMGNVGSESLLVGAGFVPVTPPVEPAAALGYYRAASAVRLIDPPKSAPLAATIDEHGPTLWVVGTAQPDQTVTVHDTQVVVRHLDADDEALNDVANLAMPLRGAAFLLARRQPMQPNSNRRGAAAIVWRSAPNGPEFLILHRSGAAPEGDWCWTPPSGGCEAGENLAECAARELHEETSLQLRLDPVTTPSSYPVFVGQAANDAVVTLDEEHDRFAWVSLEEAVRLCLPTRVGDSIRTAAGRINRG